MEQALCLGALHSSSDSITASVRMRWNRPSLVIPLRVYLRLRRRPVREDVSRRQCWALGAMLLAVTLGCWIGLGLSPHSAIVLLYCSWFIFKKYLANIEAGKSIQYIIQYKMNPQFFNKEEGKMYRTSTSGSRPVMEAAPQVS